MKDRIKHLETALVLVLALVIIYWFVKSMAYLVAALALGLIALFIPNLAGKIHILWMKLAEALGFVMSKLLLSIVFFLILVPLSILSKIFRSKNGIRLNSNEESHFIKRDMVYTKESIEEVW